MLDLRGHLRLWGRSGARRVAPPAAPTAPARPGSTLPRGEYERRQAEALCDLLDDPRSGITRVRVSSARPDLLEAVEATAARRGLLADGRHATAPGWGRLTVERQSDERQTDERSESW